MISKIITELKKIISHKYEKKFICHNKKYFADKKINNSNNGVILLEINEMQPSQIAYSYVSTILSEKYKAQIVGYHPYVLTKKQKIKYILQGLLNTGIIGVYKSYGTKSIEAPLEKYITNSQVKLKYNQILEIIKNKHDVERIEIDNIRIGDLIYDTYLRVNNLPTINLDSKSFQKHLYDSIKVYYKWKQYFNTNDVRSIIVSHPVYTLAIPLRIAVSKKIPGYLVSLQDVYYFKEGKYTAYDEFKEYRKIFEKLDKEDKIEALRTSKERIKKRFSGEVGVDMADSTRSAFVRSKYQNQIEQNKKIKILIASHCFFDSPHSYGDNLFPDFYEWFDYLGRKSNQKDYDWYVKMHPDYLPGTKEIIESFINKYKKIKLLPSEYSHHQIIEDGIDCVLTVYGTVGFEYAMMGVTVINCSPSNPHIAYDFNFHPQTILEYGELIDNIKNIKPTIREEDVLEYYFMRRIYSNNNIFFQDYESAIKKVGGYYQQYNAKMYDVWINSFNEKQHIKILNKIKKYIESENDKFYNRQALEK